MTEKKFIAEGFNECQVEKLVEIIPNLFQEGEILEILDISLDKEGNLIYASDLDMFKTKKISGHYTLENLKEALNRLYKKGFLVYNSGLGFHIFRCSD